MQLGNGRRCDRNGIGRPHDARTLPHGQSDGWARDGLPFDLRSLRFVLAAAEQLSFSAAASALNARVSSVSRRVRNLEESIGVALFERTTSGVLLTDAGHRFVADVVPALRMIEKALRNAGAAGRAERGAVRIGIITTLAGGFLREVIAEFRSEVGAVRLEIHDGGRRDHFRAIRTRELDVAFVTGNLPLADCDVLELWQERVYVAMAKDHPLWGKPCLDWADLRQEKFIVVTMDPGPEVHDYIVRRVADYSTYPDVSYRNVTQETLMHMVAMGEGITLVSEGWTNVSFPDLGMCPLTAHEDIVPLSAVWSPSNDNPALSRFLSFARTMAGGRVGPPHTL